MRNAFDIRTEKIYAREEGRAEGEAKGIAEGKAESRKEIAKKLLQMGIDIPVISEATGLSEAEIEAL